MMLPGDLSLPINGTASDVVGIFSATRLRNTVNERRIVTPEIKILDFEPVVFHTAGTAARSGLCYGLGVLACVIIV